MHRSHDNHMLVLHLFYTSLYCLGCYMLRNVLNVFATKLICLMLIGIWNIMCKICTCEFKVNMHNDTIEPFLSLYLKTFLISERTTWFPNSQTVVIFRFVSYPKNPHIWNTDHFPNNVGWKGSYCIMLMWLMYMTWSWYV